jgi:DNA-binding CsgD family transcriptional regulator
LDEYECEFDWKNRIRDEFIKDYVCPQKITYSFGFGLYDDKLACKRVLMIDRTGHIGYSSRERDILNIIVAQLGNLHRNFYAEVSDEYAIGVVGSKELLTARETEIADMICKGLSPGKIAQVIFVSRATVYKHIAHIHAKLGVSNRQELIVKLLHRKQEATSSLPEGE